jgi:hypothetical protein
MTDPEKDKQRLHKYPSSALEGVHIPPAGEYSQDDCDRVFQIDVPDQGEALQGDLIQELDRLDESSVEEECTRQPESGIRVAYYRDPFEEAVMKKFGRRAGDNSFDPRAHRGNAKRKAFAVSMLVFVVAVALMCRRILSTTVQRTEASSRNNPPAIVVPPAGIEAGWDFMNETTNETDDIWWTLEGQDNPAASWELIPEN